MENYEKLKARLAELGRIRSTAAVLGWDQQCYMPPGGAGERAEQLAVLGKIAHEMFVGDETRRLLEGAEGEVAELDGESDEAALIRVVRREFDKTVKIPTELVIEIARTTTLGHEIWVRARQDDDYPAFAPTLGKIVDLSRQVAEHLGYAEERYDALLDQYEPGRKTREVISVFDDLRPGLVELVKEIAACPPIDDDVLRRDYDEERQRFFGERVAGKMGFDFARGRQDRAVHPFCTSFGPGDVRITTRFDRSFLPTALMGTIHEVGHALYEQGFDPEDVGTPLADAASLGVHESQSRLWENIIGRSRPFWSVFFPELRQQFPEALGDADVETFYRAINKVEPSFIRVEADEVTYNLHIMLRFEIERDLLDGRLGIAEAPDAWKTKMREYLGITPPTDREGILQDVHWSEGMFGYFPTYALGTLLSAQLYDRAVADDPAIPEDLARGEFASLLGWLREKIHRRGRRFLPADLIERVCGEPAQSRSYLNYLRTKFGELYGL